jgi:hypothetical protein
MTNDRLARLTPTLPLAMAAGVAALTLAACSAGITAPATSPAPTGPVAGGTTVSLTGSLGSFPIPRGAGVLDSAVTGGGYAITLDNVTATAADTFYTAALPADGYTITQHESASGNGVSGSGMEFTGHGYKGEIATVTGPSIGTMPSMPSFAGMPTFAGFPTGSDGPASGVMVVIALVRQ